jgi:signal transduction histidine kinase
MVRFLLEVEAPYSVAVFLSASSQSVAESQSQNLCQANPLGHSPHDLHRRLDELGDFLVEGSEAGGELKLVHGLFGFEHAAGDLIDLVGDKARKEAVTIRTQFDRDLAPVVGDRVQLQQVVLNLVMNGIEALTAHEGARDLFITTRNIDADRVQVTVQDSGPGIDPDAIGKIFDPFYTTKPDGMGMGLSISRSILQSHGGRLWATANDGPGTTFHFSLPKHYEEGADERDAGV